MDDKEIEYLSLRERICELERRILEKNSLIHQKDEMLNRLYYENEELKETLNNYANEGGMYFGTRSQESITKEYLSITDAVKDFIAYDGYRLDIIIDQMPSIHIYRDELPILRDEDKIDLLLASKTLDYEAKVVIMNAFVDKE